jgi:hypothetical protein
VFETELGDVNAIDMIGKKLSRTIEEIMVWKMMNVKAEKRKMLDLRRLAACGLLRLASFFDLVLGELVLPL